MEAVTLEEIEENGNSRNVSHPIPKIIHQTWKNDEIPEKWKIAQFTWYALNPRWDMVDLSLLCSLDYHPDYHYMVPTINFYFSSLF